MAEEKKALPTISPKSAEAVEPAEENVKPVELTFEEKMLALGRLMRNKASDILKFDSTDQFDNSYVDTHQYKRMLGLMCDQVGLEFGITTLSHDLIIEHDNKGVMIFIINATYQVEFRDKNEAWRCYETAGLGISRGSAYASSIAETNALRNFIMNNFLLMGNDREDDIKASANVSKYLTEEQKAEKREELLDKTKSTAEFATIKFGEIIYKKINETLEKEIPEAFRETLVKFLEKKYTDGKPTAMENEPTMWIVKKTAANKILADLDKYAQ